jgi:hypothetical protein
MPTDHDEHVGKIVGRDRVVAGTLRPQQDRSPLDHSAGFCLFTLQSPFPLPGATRLGREIIGRRDNFREPAREKAAALHSGTRLCLAVPRAFVRNHSDSGLDEIRCPDEQRASSAQMGASSTPCRGLEEARCPHGWRAFARVGGGVVSGLARRLVRLLPQHVALALAHATGMDPLVAASEGAGPQGSPTPP